MAIPNTWKAIPKGDNWIVQTQKGQLIATIGKGKDTEANARLIAASPMMLEALSGWSLRLLDCPCLPGCKSRLFS